MPPVWSTSISRSTASELNAFGAGRVTFGRATPAIGLPARVSSWTRKSHSPVVVEIARAMLALAWPAA